MKRSITAALLMACRVAGIPSLALAAPVSVSANCGSGGGTFQTYGTADNWQDHVHDATLWHTWYYGRQYKSHSWGFETGWESGTVDGPNLASPGATCIALEV